LQINASTVALVTGGASGLGEATTRRLHEGGSAVIILDLPSSPGEALSAELGDRVRFCPADVRNETQVQAAIAAAQVLGDLRIVVNCAGIGTPGRIVSRKGPLDLESFRNVIDINLIGTFNVVRLAAAAMFENEPVDGDRGIIVMTASIAAFDGQIGQASLTTGCSTGRSSDSTARCGCPRAEARMGTLLRPADRLIRHTKREPWS